jgi:Uma2 family endonuclease
MAVATAPTLPLYRLDMDTYRRLVEGGALAGIDVELREGLLVDRGRDGETRLHRLDVDTYNRMVLTGALDDLRLELIDGLLVEMSPLSPAHNLVVTRLMRHFAAVPRWWTQVQCSLEVPLSHEPEPDLVIASHMPAPGRHLRDALLVIEVAVSSHKVDRGRKARLYGETSIPTYWLVDIPGRAVEVRTQPHPDGYERCDVYHEGSLVPSPLDGVADLDIAALLAIVEP